MQELVTRWWSAGWAWLRTPPKARQDGSVTIENVIWALAVIVIAAIVIGAITAYVTSRSASLMP